MRRFFLAGIITMLAAVNLSAALNLTANKVTIQDVTVDKNNFFVTVNASGSNNEYEVAFDVWPATHSAIGSFSRADGTISYVNCYVHQTKEGQKKVDYWYYGEYESTITLTIVKKDATTCTLSGSIEAAYNEMESFIIAPVDFAYSEDEVPEPPTQDPYRFEPTEVTTVNFNADVIAFREREGYIEVTLNEMANETYDWIELRLLSNQLAMPAGTYTIDASGKTGTLTASNGYLGSTKGDDPCYVAIRGDKEEWGQYTPYYLVSGSLEVSYSNENSIITVSGSATSHNGSTINIFAQGANPLDDSGTTPKDPEFVTLAIDTVVITYMSNLSDSANNIFVYTFSFTHQDDYPQVLTDVILSKPMEMVEGTYSLADGTIDGLILSQNQEDFEMNLFAGGAYDFVFATLTMTPAENGRWTYTMQMEDAIGSTYDFALTQTPHIILYPEPAVDPKEQPYIDEQQEKAIVTIDLDILVWDSKTVSKDGIIDIYLTQSEADINGLRAYVHLGMYTDEAYPEAGIYPVNGSEESGSFSASMGRYDNVLFPCYVALMDEAGYAHAVWYIVAGDIALSYEGENPILSGECTTHYGSTIRFSYQPKSQGVEKGEWRKANGESRKILRNGEIIIMYKGRMYDVRGRELRIEI